MPAAVAEKLKLKPLGDWVVIRPGETETKTQSGLVIPDTLREKPQEGTVLAAGPGAVDDDGERIAMDVKAGDKVLFQKYSSTEYKKLSMGTEELLLVRQKDILAIIEP
jgi:chaperonin GroES